MEEKWKKVNPVLPLDYPDPDVIRMVSVFDLVFISDHAASEKSAACAAGVGCCGSDGSDLLRKQCGTVSE